MTNDVGNLAVPSHLSFQAKELFKHFTHFFIVLVLICILWVTGVLSICISVHHMYSLCPRMPTEGIRAPGVKSFFFFFFLRPLSHWSWSIPVVLDCLATEPEILLCLCSVTFYLEAGDGTQVHGKFLANRSSSPSPKPVCNSGFAEESCSLCSLGWPGTHSVDQAGLRIPGICLPLPPECWG